MKTSKEQLQAYLLSTLSGKRFSSSNLQILNLQSENDVGDGTISILGDVLFLGNEMKMTAIVRETDKALISLSVAPNLNALVSTSIDLIGDFLAGDAGIDGDFQLKDFFPDQFPLGFISLQQIDLGFAENGPSPQLDSISIAFGIGANWELLDTRSFAVQGVNVVLANDDLSNFSSTSLSIEGQLFVNTTAFDLSVGNIRLGSPAAVLRELELKATVRDVTVPVDELMFKVLPTEAYQMWQKLTPTALRNPHIKEFSIMLQPGTKAFHILIDSNLGGFEVMSQVAEGTGKRNVLIAVAPPVMGGGSFFGNIDSSLAKLDSLELRDAGIVFSSFEDEVELMLPELQAHTIGDSPLEVVSGIQFFSKIRFRNPSEGSADASNGEDEKMLRELFDLGDTNFTLYGSIEKDLTATLEVGVDFGDKGFQIIPDREELILREVNIALILQPTPGYVGFRVGGVVDSHLKFNDDYQVDLRFGSYMEFGIVAVGSTLVMGGGLTLTALDGNATTTDGEPAIWENAFGIPGLGMQEIGGNIEMGLVLATSPLPAPTLTELGYNGTLMIGTVPEERVYAMAEVQLDVKKPTDSLIKAKLHNTSLIDLIEAYDKGNDFNIKGPVRDLLNVGFRELDINIDPPNQTFYFEVGLKSGGIEGTAMVHFSPSGIAIDGTIEPLEIEIPGTSYDLFAVRGADGDNPSINLNLDFNNPTEAKFIIDGEVSVLGGDAIGGSAKVEITPQKVRLDTDVQLFGGAFKANVDLEGDALSADGTGMYARVKVDNDVLSTLTSSLQTLMDKAYRSDRDKIDKAKQELEVLRNKSAFIATFVTIAQGALDGLKAVQSVGAKIGAMLLNILAKGFNIDHIRFESDLNALGARGGADIEAEVQLTVAGQVINPKIDIDFSLDFEAIANTIKDEMINAFDFLKDEFDKIENEFTKVFDQFEKWGKAITDFAAKAIDKIGDAFKDFFKDIDDFFKEIGNLFDNAINGQPVTLAKNGVEVPFPHKEERNGKLVGIRHYSVKLNYIKNLETTRKAKVFGYVVIKPNSEQIRLGGDSSNANLVTFSARRGSPPDPSDFDPQDGALILKEAKPEYVEAENSGKPERMKEAKHMKLFSNTKHFYVPDDGGDYKVTFVCALRQREQGDGNYGPDRSFDTVNKVLNLGTMKWEEDKDTEGTEGVQLKSKSGKYKIYLNFKATLHGKVSAETMKRHIKEAPLPVVWPGSPPPKSNIEKDFEHGGDPTFPGLMATAVAKASPYLERMQLLLNKGVRPVSSDIGVAIDKKRWDALNLLLDNGAKPLPADIEKALDKDISTVNFEKLLKFELIPSSESLVKALDKTDRQYAKTILTKNITIHSANLEKAIARGDLELLQMMLKSIALSEINSDVLLKAVEKGQRNLVTELLKKPIADQLVYQPALEKIASNLHQTFFNDFINDGARLQTAKIIDNLLLTLKNRGVTQAVVDGMLAKALQNGGDATYALDKAIALDPAFEVENWGMVLQACLANRAKPDAGIAYAVNNNQASLLAFIFGGTNLLSTKATHALRLIIEKSLAAPSGDRATERAMAKVVLDAGADPNGRTGSNTGFLLATGNAGRYELVAELLDSSASDKRMTILTTPAVFLAIRKEDGTLLSTLIDGKVDLTNEPKYVEEAVTQTVGHPLVARLLQHGAVASTPALTIALDKADFTTVDLLVDAGAAGTTDMLNKMMDASEQAVLRKLRTTTMPDLSNFQRAADLNKTDYFEILAGSDGQLTAVTPLEKAIENGNLAILEKGLTIAWPSKEALATEALAACISANWTDGLLVCLTGGANPALAVTHAVESENADLLRRIIAEFKGNADQALTDCLNFDKDDLLTIPLEAGAQPNTHMARVADAGQEERVRLLLNYGAAPDLAMMGTIRNENPPLVQHLIDKGADATKAWYLELAIEKENVPIIEILLGAGAKGNTAMLNSFMQADQMLLLVAVRKWTAPDLSNFQTAADLNRTDFFEVLATPDGLLKDVAPLNTAAQHRNLEILDIGLSIGYPNKKDLADQALTTCIAEKWKGGVMICLQQGAAPAPAVTYAVEEGDADCLYRVLNEFGGDADSALMQALDLDQDHLFSIALDAGADPNTHLVRVAEAGQESRVRLFVQYGAAPDPAVPGTIRNENAPLLQHLIDKGADAANFSYLDLAVEVGYDPVLKVLLENVPSPVNTPIRELNFFSRLVIRFGGLYSILGWSLMLVVSLIVWIMIYGEFESHFLVVLLTAFAAMVAIVAVVKNQQIGARAVQLLQKGRFAWGILTQKEDTSQGSSDDWATYFLNLLAKTGKRTTTGTKLEKVMVYEAKFFNHQEEMPYFTKVEATQEQGLLVEDEKREPIFYLPTDPQRSVLLDSIRHAPVILEDGSFEPLPSSKRVYLILPSLVIIGNLICLLVYLIN